MKSFKQTTCQGCLPVCLLLLNGKKPTPKKELKILVNGLGFVDSYALGIIGSFTKLYNLPNKLYVDNKYYCRFLKQNIKNKLIDIVFEKVNFNLIDKLMPCIIYIDSHILGTYHHSPHFIIIESRVGKKYQIIDPLFGSRKLLYMEKIQDGIQYLRQTFKYCPLLITL